MTYAPAPLVELARYWADHEGTPLGIVGDSGHTVGYHLGRDRIYDGAGPGIGGADYSVQHRRDAAGLTDAAAAIDLGRLRGSLDELYRFSRWLVRQCQAGEPGSRDVREVIYSPDGVRVQRWSGIDGQIHTGPGNGDASHTTHTHVSYFRDSERRSKLALFAPYFEDDSMPIDWNPITAAAAEAVGTVTLEPNRGLVDLVTGRAFVPDGQVHHSYARVSLEWPAGTTVTGYLVGERSHGCAAIDDAVQSFVADDEPAPPAIERYTITVDATAPPVVDPSP